MTPISLDHMTACDTNLPKCQQDIHTQCTTPSQPRVAVLINRFSLHGISVPLLQGVFSIFLFLTQLIDEAVGKNTRYRWASIRIICSCVAKSVSI